MIGVLLGVSGGAVNVMDFGFSYWMSYALTKERRETQNRIMNKNS